jgi:GNAT superfamily N-acetyltransferase
MSRIVRADLSLPAHADALIFLLNEYAKDDMGGKQELDEAVKQNLASTLAKRPGTHVVMAFVEDAPAALLISFEGFSTFACKPLLNIHDVVVLQQFRGRGLSKQLLAEAEKIALEQGCCKLTLEVLQGNHIAQAAYTAFGFSGYELSPETGKAMSWQKAI